MEDKNIATTEAAEVKTDTAAPAPKQDEFKFFKNCSASLKRFSIIIFVINLFLSIALTGVGLVLILVYTGVEMLSILALPVVTVFVILIVIARFISALIYGFAEIVEKNEKK